MITINDKHCIIWLHKYIIMIQYKYFFRYFTIRWKLHTVGCSFPIKDKYVDTIGYEFGPVSILKVVCVHLQETKHEIVN